MVTTRAQERGLQTPVSSASTKIEIVVPAVTPSPTDSPSLLRKTRSTPRKTRLQKELETMGNSASKAKDSSQVAPQLSDRDATDDNLLSEDGPVLTDNQSATPVAEKLSLSQSLDLLLPPGDVSQQHTATANETLAGPQLDVTDGASANLPERPKATSPSTQAISLNKHKRFQSEEPEHAISEANELANISVLPVHQDQHVPDSEDESDGAPEVEKIVTRKSSSQTAHGHKRRRLMSQTTSVSDSIAPISQEIFHPILEDLSPRDENGALQTSLAQTLVSGGQRVELALTEKSVGVNPLVEIHSEDQIQASSSNAILLADDSSPHTVTRPAVSTDSSRTEGQDVIALEMVNQANAISSADLSTPSRAQKKVDTALHTNEDASIAEPGNLPATTPETRGNESESHTEVESVTTTHNSYATVLDTHSVAESDEVVPVVPVEQKTWNGSTSSSRLMAAPSQPTKSRKVRSKQVFLEQTNKGTLLQDYRNRHLGRHPRTSNWGPPGFRRTKFIGA